MGWLDLWSAQHSQCGRGRVSGQDGQCTVPCVSTWSGRIYALLRVGHGCPLWSPDPAQGLAHRECSVVVG